MALCGARWVGKTTLARRLLVKSGGNGKDHQQPQQQQQQEENIAVDAFFSAGDIETASHVPLRISVWDISTQSRYMYPFWWRSSGVFILFSIHDLQSFAEAKSLIIFALEQQRNPVMYVILIGTHSDQPALRKVSTEEARALARYHDVPYFEFNLLKDPVSNLIEMAVSRCPPFFFLIFIIIFIFIPLAPKSFVLRGKNVFRDYSNNNNPPLLILDGSKMRKPSNVPSAHFHLPQHEDAIIVVYA